MSTQVCEERPPAADGHRSATSQLTDVLREHALLLGLIAGYIGVGLAVGVTHVLPRSPADLSQSIFLQLSVLVGVVLVGLTLVRTRLRVRAPDGSRLMGWPGWLQAWRIERQAALSPWRLGRFCLVLVAVSLFARAFIGWKAAIPSLNAFSWDAQLNEWDLTIHGGSPPWLLLQPLIGRPGITRFLDLVYLLWHPVTIGVVVWQAWHPSRIPRMRFFLSFVLVWMFLGSALATAMSSAGPCYYDLVTGQTGPYLPLLDYLRSVDARTGLGNLEAQRWLWSNYVQQVESVSISAMPSLHVAMPVLYVCATLRSRFLLVCFSTYAILIFLASIHLGWHYAVDGYVSALAVPLIWYGVCRLVPDHGNAPSNRNFVGCDGHTPVTSGSFEPAERGESS